MGIATIGALGSGYMAYQQSEAQKDAQKEYNEALETEAVRQYGELDEAEGDIIYESHAQSLEAQRQLLEARSQIELESAVTGTYGGAVDAAMDDLSSGFGYKMAEVTRNKDIQLRNVVSTAESIRAGAVSSADLTPTAPSWYTAGMTGLQTGATITSLGRQAAAAGAGG